MERMWFQLPGPSRFAERVTESLDSGRNVIVCVPRALDGSLRETLRARLSEGSRAWRQLIVDGSSSPMEAMRQSFVASRDHDRVSDVMTLAQCSSFRGLVVWIEPANASAEAMWRTFVIDYSNASRVRDEHERVAICVVTHDRTPTVTVREDVTLSFHSWDGHIGSLDVWAYVRYRREPTDGLDEFYDHLAGALVADIAGYDMNLAERLSNLSIRELHDPIPVLVAYARSNSWTNECMARPSWGDSHIGVIDGGRMIHPALLAIGGDGTAIYRRVWQAQLRVLFPLLEQLRIWLVPQASRLIRPPFMTLLGQRQVVLNSIADLELGQLEYHLSGTRLYPRVHCLADMRRHLAHLEVVGINDLLSSEFQSILRDYRTG